MTNHLLLSLALLAPHFFGGAHCYPHPAENSNQPHQPQLPSRILAGVSVVDTPIVRDAINYSQEHEDSSVHNHSMRTWLYGSIIINKNPDYTAVVDREVHALGSILHDVTLDPTTVHMDGKESADGIAAMGGAAHGETGGKAVRAWLANNKEGKAWPEGRIKVLVDAVTLHLEDSDSSKAAEIRAVRDGQQIDLNGPSGFVTKAEADAIDKAFPLGDMTRHSMGSTAKGSTSASGGMAVHGETSSGHGDMSAMAAMAGMSGHTA